MHRKAKPLPLPPLSDDAGAIARDYKFLTVSLRAMSINPRLTYAPEFLSKISEKHLEAYKSQIGWEAIERKLKDMGL